ncbi:MAG: hypothetical protein ACRDCY_18115 [Aeromonas veronii]
MQLIEALKALDPDNNEHWTQEGLPVVAEVAKLTGVNVTRAEVTAAAPHFNRNNLSLEPVVTDNPWGASGGDGSMTGTLSGKVITGATYAGGGDLKPSPNGEGQSRLELAQAAYEEAATRFNEAKAEMNKAADELSSAQAEHAEANTLSHAEIVKMAQRTSIAEQAGQQAKLKQMQELMLSMPPTQV